MPIDALRLGLQGPKDSKPTNPQAVSIPQLCPCAPYDEPLALSEFAPADLELSECPQVCSSLESWSPGAEDAGAKQREDMLQLRCYGCSMDFRREILRREPSTSLMVAFPSKEMDTLIESCTHGRHGMQPCTAFLWKSANQR